MCYACGHGVLKGLWSACSASQAKLISGIPKARELVVRMVLSKDYGGAMAAAVAFGRCSHHWFGAVIQVHWQWWTRRCMCYPQSCGG